MFDDAAVTVNRVFTQAYVGDQKKVTNVLAYCTKRLLNDAILVVGVGRQIILLLGNPKKKNAGNTRLLGLSRNLDRVVDGKIILARHRPHFDAHLVARTHKNRINHRLRRQSGFPDHVPQTFTAAEPAHPMCWKRHTKS